MQLGGWDVIVLIIASCRSNIEMPTGEVLSQRELDEIFYNASYSLHV